MVRNVIDNVVDKPWHQGTWRDKPVLPASRRLDPYTWARTVSTGRTWADANSQCELKVWTHEPAARHTHTFSHIYVTAIVLYTACHATLGLFYIKHYTRLHKTRSDWSQPKPLFSQFEQNGPFLTP